ncbi:hypothetical protein N7448_007661 [Penicillium atrosanguineum]|uniref:Chromosome segregation protein BIR1 n=1 Tax=Penicillium atrosanguineum TaxID=1132637 RepID=A0A9W9QDD4_9EURO|nr:uncharacterized protein N7443_001315 [Penicillium atrosanguineum]KAJ5126882.1 hypothetical protein N7448_007661 [Penicillium atrosanguineum]KAJ5147089.1 hypothetical protein N7526_000441 [Penicillium atrosanguineum]KAJ5314431.1 hypothetical protein N7443_001315 [Penicillium atrosanguineum]KAJ5331601.1 hypothetical protein N7476_001384 [Penicillium atrosanguineum]
MSTDMDTFAARLASFDTVLKPERRSSTTKSSKTIGWPHHSPSPAELAHAGFYYKPYETNPDNTTCFQCNRALDGWEEEDNPITEHLKHSPDCGWAIIMDIQQRSSNPATIEDPTGDRITQARIATFGAAWPHDGKRGWVCQSEKMVEGGWYFCPSEESDDLASCPYCKLSLDGWEPKDDPFDEHYRRSSDCSFFVFAQPPAKKGKGSKSKKGRTSKASSRLSTQSVATTTSEALEMDVDESMDQSIMSQATVKPKTSKKGTKGKGKSSKSKKEDVEVESQVDVDEIELVQSKLEPVKPKRGTKGKKRVSEEMNNDEPEPVQEDFHESPPPPEPPAKRRATKTRSSVSQAFDYDHIMADTGSVDEAPQEETAKKGRKKKGTSKSRKASDVSVASKSTSKAHVPRDSELEAALEAGLDADVPEPAEEEEQEPEPEKPRPSKKNKGGKKAKAAAESPEPPQEPEEPEFDQDEQPDAAVEPHVPEMEEHQVPEEPEEPEEPVLKSKLAKASKKKGSKKSKKEESSKAPATQDMSEFKSAAEDRRESDRHESFVSVEITNKESESQREPETEPEEKVVKKKSSKKDVKAKKSKKSKKTEESPPPEPVQEQRDFRPPSRDVDDVFGTPDDISDQVEMVAAPHAPSPEPPVAHERTPVPVKTTKRFSDIPQEEHLAQSFSESQGSARKERLKPQRTSESSNRAVSPLPTARLSTPSMSPQSSDAENHPPSSRPSTTGPAVPSASKELKPRTPLVASTPSPSKRNANAGFPPSGHPWTPVDIDEVLFGEASDKENADLVGMFKNVKGTLTSPEKKMTVEEWIVWNAKNGEEHLKRECERLVSQFEKEGGRAMQRLEAIECMD